MHCYILLSGWKAARVLINVSIYLSVEASYWSRSLESDAADYGPSRLRVDDDDDGVGLPSMLHLYVTLPPLGKLRYSRWSQRWLPQHEICDLIQYLDNTCVAIAIKMSFFISLDMNMSLVMLLLVYNSHFR